MKDALRKRLERLSTNDLISAITENAHAYTPEAHDVARELLAHRDVQVQNLPAPTLLAPEFDPLYEGEDRPFLHLNPEELPQPDARPRKHREPGVATGFFVFFLILYVTFRLVVAFVE